ncbi:hypothetical protein E2C01_052872 [Portunus trituberculatus]|uniref:Uncharacterized protein n=1 Tax=Portunus trituberculatus TaxID=210409 RepID=A0A5B7GIU8_PORTR|nr:hypothetical protein [Portunus trituberculatus]
MKLGKKKKGGAFSPASLTLRISKGGGVNSCLMGTSIVVVAGDCVWLVWCGAVWWWPVHAGVVSLSGVPGEHRFPGTNSPINLRCFPCPCCLRVLFLAQWPEGNLAIRRGGEFREDFNDSFPAHRKWIFESLSHERPSAAQVSWERKKYQI